MDGNALNVVSVDFDLTGMKAATDLNVERTDGVGNRLGATDSARRSVERSQKSVAKRFHLAAPISREFPPHTGVMSLKQIAPTPVTYLLGARSRADDVGEQNG